MGTVLGNLEFTIELIAAEALFLIGTRRRTHFGWRFLVFAVLISGLSLLLSYEEMSKLPTASFRAMLVLRFLMLFALTIVGIWFCFDCKAFHILFCATGGYLLQHVAFSLIELLKHGWDYVFPQVQVSSAAQTLLNLVLHALVYIVAYFLLLRGMARSDMGADLWSVLLMSVGTLTVAVVLSLFAYEFDAGPAMVCRALSLVACLMGLSSLTELRKNRYLQNEMEILNQKLALRAEQYQLLKDSIDATNILCHDFKHKITQLRERQTQSDAETINELEAAIQKYDHIARTGNEVLDTILTEKNLICDRAGIRFTYMIDQEALRVFKDTDMYALFGNALDNAIEAARQLPDQEQRVITVSADRKGQFLNIHVYNFFAHDLELIEGLPATTKEDKRYHGYGLKSIRAILLRYGGEMEISANDNIFDLNMVIPIAE